MRGWDWSERSRGVAFEKGLARVYVRGVVADVVCDVERVMRSQMAAGRVDWEAQHKLLAEEEHSYATILMSCCMDLKLR